MKTLMIVMLSALAACTSQPKAEKVSSDPADLPVAGESAAAVASTGSYGSADGADSSRDKVTVLFFGTSLTAGYGLNDTRQAFPNLVAQKAAASGTPIVAINAGLSGETSAGALRRIDWTLKRPVDIVMVETGANDGLRALDPDTLRDNLEQIVARIRAAQPKARILIAAMEAPPNLGKAYTQSFNKAYTEVAAREKLTVVPFLLNGVAGKSDLNQADGVHPNEKGEPIVAENVWKALKPVVRQVYEGRKAG